MVGSIGQVFVRTLDTPNPVQLTECRADCFPIGWSADSARVYYKQGAGLWAISATGGAAQLVMKEAGPAPYSTALSPDGQSLVFGRVRADGKTDLLISAPPGAEPKPMPDFAPTPAEAAENGLLDRGVAQGIVSLKGVRQSGNRAGNWLTGEQARVVHALAKQVLAETALLALDRSPAAGSHHVLATWRRHFRRAQPELNAWHFG
jgi:hypothetical protein